MEHQEMVTGSLIPLHPDLVASTICPKCKSDTSEKHDYLFQGIHVLVDCTCKQCATRFYYTLPIGHDAITPTAISHDGKHVSYHSSAEAWLAKPLIDSLLNDSSKRQAEISQVILETLKDKVIILNCLDDCFGHAYAKMLNALQLLRDYPDHSLILIITKNLEWLVPGGVSELWIVHESMRNMKYYITTLQEFVKTRVNKTSQYYLSTAKVYHHLHEINSEPFLKTKRFDLSQFGILPYSITFILREDRYWHPTMFDNFINLVSIKLKIKKYFKRYFTWQQDRLVKKVIRLILTDHPGVQINITGIGSFSRMNNGVNDLRVDNITPAIERQWCEIYSRSQVVVGVHGSNMIIPSSLAAGFIEILPRHKIAHLGEDTVLHHTGRTAMLLGRYVDAYAAPGLVAQHVSGMLKFADIDKLMSEIK
jgi:hypothetical protein